MDVYKPFMKYWERDKLGVRTGKLEEGAPQWAKDDYEVWKKERRRAEFLSI